MGHAGVYGPCETVLVRSGGQRDAREVVEWVVIGGMGMRRVQRAGGICVWPEDPSV